MGSVISAGLGPIGAIFGAVGSFEQGQAAADSAKFNAQVARQNAAISMQNSAIAGQAGSEQSFMSGEKTRSLVGNLKVNEAAAGVDVNSGSAQQTRQSADALGQLDAMTIRSNATREAYGYAQQANSQNEQADLDMTEAKNDSVSAELNATSTFLGSAGSSANNFARYQLAGGFSG